MKAVSLQAYGDVDQFKLVDLPDPAPGAGEVLIRVAVSGLNPVDLYIRQGYMHQFDPMDLPGVIGGDAAGTVVATGEGVSGFAPGDRVAARSPNRRGAHAELAVVAADSVARLPADLTFETAATLPLVGLAGRQSVDALGIKAGDRVLVAGALGGAGRAAVQYLKELGAIPVAGVRTERLAEGQALAGEAVDINAAPSAPSFSFAVSTAPAAAANVVGFVVDGGKIASLVQTPAEANEGNRVEVLQIMGRADGTMLHKLAETAARGDLTLPIARTFRLAELAEAHRALADNPRGKIILSH